MGKTLGYRVFVAAYASRLAAAASKTLAAQARSTMSGQEANGAVGGTMASGLEVLSAVSRVLKLFNDAGKHVLSIRPSGVSSPDTEPLPELLIMPISAVDALAVRFLIEEHMLVAVGNTVPLMETIKRIRTKELLASLCADRKERIDNVPSLADGVIGPKYKRAYDRVLEAYDTQ